MRSKACRARPCPRRCSRPRSCPRALPDYAPAGLDTLIAAGEVAWAGVEPIGERDGRIALFLADKLPLLAQQRPHDRTAHRARRKAAGRARIHRRQLLRSAASGARRRLSRRDNRCVVEPGLARPHHQRFAACAARLHRPARERAHAAPPADRRGLSLPPHHAAHRARPLVAACRVPVAQTGPKSRRTGSSRAHVAHAPKPATRSPCNCSIATACCCANR